jgi:DNA-binding response OmpR family regulator
MSTPRIVLMEPDPALRRVLTRRLEDEGYGVRPLEAPDSVLEALREAGADVLVTALPNGLEVVPPLRDRSSVIVVAMLPRDADPARGLDALDAGADDFVIKPFSPRELMSRLHALLRRASVGAVAQPGRLEFEGLVIDTVFREVTVRGATVALPAKEFDLLVHLASSPRQVFTRQQLMMQIWGIDIVVTTATITEHIRRLRNRIEEDPRAPRWIETVWSVGYRFNPAGRTPAQDAAADRSA